jgi:hypothetical protein
MSLSKLGMRPSQAILSHAGTASLGTSNLSTHVLSRPSSPTSVTLEDIRSTAFKDYLPRNSISSLEICSGVSPLSHKAWLQVKIYEIVLLLLVSLVQSGFLFSCQASTFWESTNSIALPRLWYSPFSPTSGNQLPWSRPPPQCKSRM